MTRYAIPRGLLSDQYAGAFKPGHGFPGLLADPAVLAQAMRLLNGRGGTGAWASEASPAARGFDQGTPRGNDAIEMPESDPMAQGAIAPGAIAPGAIEPGGMAPGSGGRKPGGALGGAATQPAEATAAPAPRLPARTIPAGFAMPIAPRAALSDIYGLYAPAASPDGRLPPMGLGGLRRLYASPETLAAEAEAARARASTTAYDGYGPMGRPYDAGGGDGTGTQAGDPSDAGATGTSHDPGGGQGMSGGQNGTSAGSQGGMTSDSDSRGSDPGDGDGDSGGGGPTARRGAYVTPDRDGRLEARKYTLHEGEVVMNPEATALLGPARLMAINRRALAGKRRPAGLLG